VHECKITEYFSKTNVFYTTIFCNLRKRDNLAYLQDRASRARVQYLISDFLRCGGSRVGGARSFFLETMALYFKIYFLTLQMIKYELRYEE
jgi:hypothetical protein